MKFSVKAGLAAFALSIGLSTSAMAGPFILAGTDADDHGSATGNVNEEGWFFMQRAIENIATGVTNGNKKVTILGSTSSAATAANSAFNNSLLVGAGWTVETVDIANFGTFFGSGGGVNNTGILMMDSGNNLPGGVDGSNFVPYASAINSFLGAGGGLFSQANGYQWLSALLPNITVDGFSNTGLSLTSAGNTAFPGLTDADLSAGPFHQRFDNIGNLSLFAVYTGDNTSKIIIGGGGGSITDPCANRQCDVPEPTSGGLILAALGGVVLVSRLRRRV